MRRSVFLRCPIDSIRTALRLPTATLKQSITALSEHAGNADVVADALSAVTRLDQSDDDSREIALGPGRVAVVQCMQAHVNNLHVKEMCCRSIANMCLLEDLCDGSTIADSLVESNAVEMVLGTMACASQVSPKGLCWCSMALLNLVLRSVDGAMRAGRHSAEDTIATCIERVLIDATAASSVGVTTVDAALGALCRIAASGLTDDHSGLQFRFQIASYNVVDCVVASMTSRVLCPDFNQRLPILHKGWEFLRLVSNHNPNLPLVFGALYDHKALPIAVPDILEVWERCAKAGTAGGGAVNEEVEILNKTFDAALDALVDLSAPRRDVSAPAADGAASPAGGIDASPILPTEAAAYVVASLGDGNLSSAALQMLHGNFRFLSVAVKQDTTPDVIHVTTTRSTRLISLLTNLAEHDPVVASASSVALLQEILKSYVKAPLVVPNHISLVVRSLSCLWNIANRPEGVDACRDLLVPATIDDLARHIAHEKLKLQTSSLLSAPQREESANGAQSSEAEASATSVKLLDELLNVSKKLQSKFNALITEPTFAYTKHGQAPGGR